jgi:hypothetical protein
LVAKQRAARRNAGDEGAVRTTAPVTVRAAGALAALEGLTGLIIAIVLVVQGAGHGGAQAYGTAAWFAILAGAVLAAGTTLFAGHRWGRAIVVIAQILLLPAAWYMLSSHRFELGIPVGLAALVTLGLIFAPPSVQWMASGYDTDPEG